MSCQAVKTHETYRIVVKFPLPLTERCQLCLGNCLRCCKGQLKFLCLILGLLVLAFTVSGFWIAMIVVNCSVTSPLALEDLNIRSMTVHQNFTVATPENQWQVKSEFNVTLSARNRNTVAGCFSTYRRMVVYVAYDDKLILKQEVPLGFGLKPRTSRAVVVEVKGDHFPVTKQLGQLLDAELRNASSVHFQMNFDTRVIGNDRTAEWIRMACQVIARTPMNSSQMSGNLLWKACKLRG